MNKTGTIWIIIGIVVIVLLALFAFNRPPAAVVNEANENAQQAGENTADASARAAVRTKAAADLAALRVRAEAGESYESLAGEYAQIRARVAASYDHAEGAAKEEWSQLDAAFDEFEASARAGSSNVLDAFARLIASFSADVRTETEAEAR